MNKDSFQNLFLTFIFKEVEEFSDRKGSAAPKGIKIAFHGFGHSGDIISTAEAIGLLYISSEKFFRIIDVGILDIDRDFATVFVRPSGHAPGCWGKTWDPGSYGPFKAIEAKISL